MNVKLDAFIAEIARTLDANLLRYDENFEDLWRPNRMHFILASLAGHDIARGEKWGRKVVRWWPSRRLESRSGVKRHGIPAEVERTERPVGISTLADEFSEFLRAHGEMVEEAAAYVLHRFAMYEAGLLEYRGKKNGLFQFKAHRRSA
jgi:hypothetical protein